MTLRYDNNEDTLTLTLVANAGNATSRWSSPKAYMVQDAVEVTLDAEDRPLELIFRHVGNLGQNPIDIDLPGLRIATG